MAVYVDKPTDYGNLVQGEARRYGTIWSHMTGDTDDELHRMAEKLNLKRRYFQHGDHPHQAFHHYDITPGRRHQAIRLGAIAVDECPVMRKYVQQDSTWAVNRELANLSW